MKNEISLDTFYFHFWTVKFIKFKEDNRIRYYLIWVINLHIFLSYKALTLNLDSF